MLDRITRLGGLAALCVALGSQNLWAQETPSAGETPGATVSVEAKLLKDADEVAFSAQQLRPIALDRLPTPIDLSALPAADAPGMAVSGTARTLRDLDPADIPGTARTLGGLARGGLPDAAGSAGSRAPSLPPAAQNRSRGRGGR